MQDKDVYNGGVVATRDTLQVSVAGKQVFVTAVEKGFYLKTRKRGETFGYPAEWLYNEDGSPKAKKPSWFVEASEGDIERSQAAVEVDVARAHASPRYQPANSPELARAANAARADAVKAAEVKPKYDETPEEKAARLQSEARADVDQAQRQTLADEERAIRNRQEAEAKARQDSAAARQTPAQADAQAHAAVEGARLRDEASRLDAQGGKDNQAKAKKLREQADALDKKALGSDLA